MSSIHTLALYVQGYANALIPAPFALHFRNKRNLVPLASTVLQIGDEGTSSVLEFRAAGNGMNSLFLESGARAAIHIKEGGRERGNLGRRERETSERAREFPSLSPASFAR